MSDADKIRRAFEQMPLMDFRIMDVWRKPEPIELLDFASGVEAPMQDCEVGIVEFRREVGTMDGRPWARIIGKLRDTEIVVAEGPR